MPLQGLGAKASRARVWERSRQGAQSLRGTAPQEAGSPGRAAPQDAAGAEELQSPREI